MHAMVGGFSCLRPWLTGNNNVSKHREVFSVQGDELNLRNNCGGGAEAINQVNTIAGCLLEPKRDGNGDGAQGNDSPTKIGAKAPGDNSHVNPPAAESTRSPISCATAGNPEHAHGNAHDKPAACHSGLFQTLLPITLLAFTYNTDLGQDFLQSIDLTVRCCFRNIQQAEFLEFIQCGYILDGGLMNFKR